MTWDTGAVPLVDRGNGVSLWWEAWGEGPGVLVAQSFIQHPEGLAGLMAALEDGHRLIRYDPRGAGRSTRRGPYDRATDVADLIAVVEAAAPVAVVLASGDATNRAVHAAASRPDLIGTVVSMENVPLVPRQAQDTDALAASTSVLEALVGMMRADYRSGLVAAIQRGNPEMGADELRARVDRTAAYSAHEAALARLEQWIGDEPGDHSRALGDRLVIAYEGSGGWFPAELVDHARALLPAAQFVKLERGALTQPELTAAVVRRISGATAP